MTPTATLLWLLCVSIDMVGHLSFKAAAKAGNVDSQVESWRLMLTNPLLWVGISGFVIEFFVFMAFVAMVPLSLATLVSTFNIILVMIGGRIVFKEALTKPRLIAVVLITVGVMLVGWGKA